MKKIFFLLVFPFLISCGKIKKVDRTGMELENAGREVKVVKDSEILMMAQTIGNEISQKEFTNPQIKKLFEDSLNQRGFSISNLQLSDTLNRISAEELSLLQAYAYNLENGFKLESNLQVIDKQIYLYTYPKMNGDSSLTIVSIRLPKKEIISRF